MAYNTVPYSHITSSNTLPHGHVTHVNTSLLRQCTGIYAPTGGLPSTRVSTTAAVGRGLSARERATLEGKHNSSESDYWTVPQVSPDSWTTSDQDIRQKELC